MKNQKEAVYEITLAVMKEKGIHFEDGMNIKKVCNEKNRAIIIELVTEGIVNETICFSDEAKTKYNNRPKIVSYVKGLVNNHFTKDTRLNGGDKYIPKNPGSRTGMNDPTLKALKQTLKVVEGDAEKVAMVEHAIKLRQAEIEEEKKNSIEINMDALPEDIKKLLG